MDDGIQEFRSSRSRVPTTEQREMYLGYLEDGLPTNVAAEKAMSTGSAFRSLRRRDPSFDEECRSREELHGEARNDWLRESFWKILSDPSHPKYFDALKMLAETHLPETEFKRIRSIQQKTT